MTSQFNSGGTADLRRISWTMSRSYVPPVGNTGQRGHPFSYHIHQRSTLAGLAMLCLKRVGLEPMTNGTSTAAFEGRGNADINVVLTRTWKTPYH